jgi:thiosulfate reductase cytochrome b subunit
VYGLFAKQARLMTTKVLLILVLVAMGLHLIKPFGLPGLRRRGDVWKIALILIFAMMMALVLRPA